MLSKKLLFKLKKNLIIWLFLFEASEALFLFFAFSGLRVPFWRNLFTRGGKMFRQGSFLIIWLYWPRLLMPFFAFFGPQRPFTANLFTRGGNNFQQGSFFILWLFSSEALFCFLRFSGLRPFTAKLIYSRW